MGLYQSTRAPEHQSTKAPKHQSTRAVVIYRNGDDSFRSGFVMRSEEFIASIAVIENAREPTEQNPSKEEGDRA